uniref:Uncharacterized protein n=1 Tax=Panagrolaimus superbus TaxID=310955 RepID=A0A914Z9W0_9BILA
MQIFFYILEKRSPKELAVVEETLQLYDQKPQNLQIPSRPSPLEDSQQQIVGQRPSPGEPSSPKILINNQQKGSSSSEENGFIKVYPEQTLQQQPLHQQQQQQQQFSNEYENVGGAVGSPRPSSYDAGSSVTADDIEFVHSADNSPRMTDYPDVFGYENENIQSVGKIRPSDDLEDYENISSQNIWQQQQQPQQLQHQQMNQQHQQQQLLEGGEGQKKSLNPEEVAHMRQLLNEYDLNSVREPSEADNLRQQQQVHPQTQHQKQQQSLPPEIWQTQDILLEQSEQPSKFQSPQFQQQSPNAQQNIQQQQQDIFAQNEPQFHQQKMLQQNQQHHQQDLEFQPPQFQSAQNQLHQQPQYPQPQGQQPQSPSSPFQSLEQQQPHSSKQQKSKSKSPVQAFHEGENIAEFLFQMPSKSKQQLSQAPNDQATFILQNNSQKQGASSRLGFALFDEDDEIHVVVCVTLSEYGGGGEETGNTRAASEKCFNMFF